MSKSEKQILLKKLAQKFLKSNNIQSGRTYADDLYGVDVQKEKKKSFNVKPNDRADFEDAKKYYSEHSAKQNGRINGI